MNSEGHAEQARSKAQRTAKMKPDREKRLYDRLGEVAGLLCHLAEPLPAGQPCLVYRHEDQSFVVPLPPRDEMPFSVGRDKQQVNLCLKEPTVSAQHFQLLWVNGVMAVRDMGSRNGTRVNGERLTGTRPLCNGDLIKAAGQKLVYVHAPLDFPVPPSVPSADEHAETEGQVP